MALGPVTDPGDDTVTEYIVDWGDGDVETFSTPGDKTHTYTDGGVTATITCNLIDEDGTYPVAGQFVVTVNLLGSIGATVFSDVNNDGNQDEGEDGIEGVTVTLSCILPGDEESTEIASLQTDENGKYIFEDVPLGIDCNVEVDGASPALGDKVIGQCLPVFESIILPDNSQPDPNSYLIADFCFVEPGATGICLVIIDETGLDNDFFTVEQLAASHGVQADSLINDAEEPDLGIPLDVPTEISAPRLRWNQLFPGDIVKLPTGQVDDEGWFALPEIIEYIDNVVTFPFDDVNGASITNSEEGIAAFVDGTLPQDKLDKVRDVMPLRNKELVQLVGRTCVAVVFDSDISMNYEPIYANLQGERNGLFTFTVLATEVPGGLQESQSDTSLYDLWLRVEPPMIPNVPFEVAIRDNEPDAIEINKAKQNSSGELTVFGESDFAPDALMTVTVDGPDAGADPDVDAFVLEAPMTYNPSKNCYEYMVTTTENLGGRRLTIQTDEGGAYTVVINGGVSAAPSLRPDLLEMPAELQQIAPVAIPRETRALPNFPNPFNPETWIPYTLANDVNVKIEIYAVKGRLVRTLDLGFQSAGYYTDRSKAGYWDGRNEFGERVASGVYLYRLTAGSYTTIRKTLIVK